MEIPKYLEPEWVKKLKSGCREYGTSRNAINSGITIKLKNPAGGINDYHIRRTMSFKGSYGWLIDADMVIIVPTPDRPRKRWHQEYRKVRLGLDYDISNDKLSIINSTDGYDQGIREGEYDFVGDIINEEWKLQLARMRLALTSSLHERLGNESLYDLPGDIISCIGENIEAAVGERPLIDERPLIGNNDGEAVEDYDSDDGFGGGGYTFKYKKKRKSKKKRKKTKRKRRKTKRKRRKNKIKS